MTPQGAGQRGGYTPCLAGALGLMWERQGGAVRRSMLGSPWCCLGSPHSSMMQHRTLLPGPLPPAQGDAG